MELLIRPSDCPFPGERRLEVVERKGLGHPDTLCDALAEEISRALCRRYQEMFGIILHHNVDKVLLVGGRARARFGGGEVLEPLDFYLGGRATSEAEGRSIPVDEIAVEACRGWLRAHMRHLDPDRHVRFFPRIRAGSLDLTGLFARGRARPLANDTSCGVGFAPLSELERVVLAVERRLNAPEVKRSHPAIGEDIKVMGVRVEDRITLTIGCAFVAPHLADLAAYVRAKEETAQVALEAARGESTLPLDALVNAGDDLGRGEVYLTVTGTSAESGDDGEVGRGNRVNGLITPQRPMTMEAAAGKNPVSHVGKIYNVAAGRIAETLVRTLPGVRNAECLLLSQIGRAVDDPHVADVALALDAPARLAALREAVGDVVRDQLARLPELRRDLVEGRVEVC